MKPKAGNVPHHNVARVRDDHCALPFESGGFLKKNPSQFHVSGILFRVKIDLHMNYCTHNNSRVKKFESFLEKERVRSRRDVVRMGAPINVRVPTTPNVGIKDDHFIASQSSSATLPNGSLYLIGFPRRA